MGRVLSTTEASTAGMLTLYSPWKVHSARGRTRRPGLWVRTSGSRNPFQTCRPGRVGVAAYNESGESEIAWAS